MYVVTLVQTGSNQFSNAAAVTVFEDGQTVSDVTFQLPVNYAPVIHGYSYNSGSSTAHSCVLRLSPAVNTTDYTTIILENLTGITSFTQACGVDGIVVPRIPLAGDNAKGNPYMLLFSTSGKDATAQLTVWYSIVQIG